MDKRHAFFFLAALVACAHGPARGGTGGINVTPKDLGTPNPDPYTFDWQLSLARPPERPEPAVKPSVWYSSTWQLREGAAGVSYCVFPQLRTTGSRRANPTLPFTLELRNLSQPTANFEPLRVPGNVPANTRLPLQPKPKWCGVTPAGTQAPPKLEIRVVETNSKDAVRFAPPRFTPKKR